MESLTKMSKEKTIKVIDWIRLKTREGKDNLREWLYTYLFESVSLPEVFDFGVELARVRKRPLTIFMLMLTAIVYRIESGFKSTFAKKSK